MFDLSDYPSPIQQVLVASDGGERLMPLVPRGPLGGGALDQLAATDDTHLVSPQSLASREFGKCVRSASRRSSNKRWQPTLPGERRS